MGVEDKRKTSILFIPAHPIIFTSHRAFPPKTLIKDVLLFSGQKNRVHCKMGGWGWRFEMVFGVLLDLATSKAKCFLHTRMHAHTHTWVFISVHLSLSPCFHTLQTPGAETCLFCFSCQVPWVLMVHGFLLPPFLETWVQRSNYMIHCDEEYSALDYDS